MHKGCKMAQKRVTLSIDEDVLKRFDKVAKRLKLSKSGIVEEFLIDVLPIFEKENPVDMVGSALKKLGEGLSEVADDLEKK
jgi:metal-responsive CopG/Arc/MetJ family transcriptional regulator